MEILAAVEQLALVRALKTSFYIYPLVNAAHIFSLALLIGSILPADLRILGFFPEVPAAPFLQRMTAFSATGLTLAICTGLLLFSVRPLEYISNPAFLTKISLVALGTGNALIVRLSSAWREAVKGNAIGPGLRAGAVASLAIWIAALLAGRWIAFL